MLIFELDGLGTCVLRVVLHHSFATGFSQLEDKLLIFFNLTFVPFQPMEIYVDDEAKLTLHGLVQV